MGTSSKQLKRSDAGGMPVKSFSIIRLLKCTKYQKKSTTVHHRPKDVKNEQNEYQIVS